MQAFKGVCNDTEYTFVCQYKNTRNGFKHECEVLNDKGYAVIDPVKICYLNRTWERYRFQSVLHKAVDALVKHTERTKEDAIAIKRSVDRNAGYPNAD